jgi:hypothetical protein
VISSGCRFFRLLFRGGLVVMGPMMFAVAGAVLMMVPAARCPGAGRLWLRRIRGTLRRALRWRSGLLSGQSNYWRGCENEYD